MAETLLHFDDVSFAWDTTRSLLRDISLSIAPNDCLALVGKNGAGKSTLLKLACGLNKPARGRVCIGDLNTPTARPPQLAKRVALMFQEAERQICHDRVASEVGFAPRLAGHDQHEVHHRVTQALEITGLCSRKDCHPLDLNAGERRMLTLASLIAQDTALILLDEPTRDFDAPLLARFERWMTAAQRQGRSILFISHDLDFVARRANRVLHLSHGSISAIGTATEVLRHPELQEASTMAAPTLPALCQALHLPVCTDLEGFQRHWRNQLTWRSSPNSTTMQSTSS